MRLLCLLVPLLSSQLACAQGAPASTTPATLSLAPAPDTAAAPHRLFAQKRREHTGLAVVLLVGGAVFFGAATQSPTIDGATLPLSISILSVPAAAAVLVGGGRYSRWREERALAALRAHHLPRFLQRNLKATYFQRAQ